MTKMGKSVTWVCLLLFILATACSGNAPKAATIPLKIEWTLWQGDYTLLVADQMGFFAKHGIDVEAVRYDSASPAIADLAGLKLDGGLFTMSDLILASNLTDLKGVMVSDNGGVFSVVATSDITKIQQLRGKRIGLSFHTAGEMFVTNMLKSGRMTSKDVTYVEMAPAQVPSAIPANADAGLVWEPYTSQALRQGQTVLYQSADNSALMPKLLAFRNAIIQQHPDFVRNFILAWDEAVAYRINHPQESLAIISKATGLLPEQLSLTKDITLYTIRDNIQLFTVNREKDPTSIYHIAGVNRDFLVINGYITVPPDLDSLLDPTFLR